MLSVTKIIGNLGSFARNYTQDLVKPFEDNNEANADAETPLLIISDVCKLIGLTSDQTYRVLGRDGAEFVEYLESATFLVLDPPIETVQLFGRSIPVAGTVGEGGKVTFNAWAGKLDGITLWKGKSATTRELIERYVAEHPEALDDNPPRGTIADLARRMAAADGNLKPYENYKGEASEGLKGYRRMQ